MKTIATHSCHSFFLFVLSLVTAGPAHGRSTRVVDWGRRTVERGVLCSRDGRGRDGNASDRRGAIGRRRPRMTISSGRPRHGDLTGHQEGSAPEARTGSGIDLGASR